MQQWLFRHNSRRPEPPSRPPQGMILLRRGGCSRHLHLLPAFPPSEARGGGRPLPNWAGQRAKRFPLNDGGGSVLLSSGAAAGRIIRSTHTGNNRAAVGGGGVVLLRGPPCHGWFCESASASVQNRLPSAAAAGLTRSSFILGKRSRLFLPSSSIDFFFPTAIEQMQHYTYSAKGGQDFFL